MNRWAILWEMRTAPGAQKFPGLTWMTQPLWPKAEGRAGRGDVPPSQCGLGGGVARERIVQGGTFDPKGPTNRRFARAGL